ncbi:class I SAM-dependent methyltransferase [Actinoalloteichus spitiensis]|uniref:class I SAM-dependent methyltransferase n=1 Tax=Actinoalloteichus spitiensis TaxID=252394 RepID=UPI00038123A5|nr:class I SAM-dependent methyltransferase [Actinoalloteichus spitiensis]
MTSSPQPGAEPPAAETTGEARYRHAEDVLGTSGVSRTTPGAAAARAASRAWWDADADDYQREHGDFLGLTEFRWAPEGITERDLGLLGDVRGASVLEVGCGSASCSRWLRTRGARPVAMDLSSGMLRHAALGAAESGVEVPLVQASADALPFASESFDLACSAFGAVPFVSDLDQLTAEVARVLRPGGRWVFAVNHPMRWIFPDDPGPAGLTVRQSYFDRTPYVEVDEDGAPTYVEYHRTIGDHVRALAGAGLHLVDLVEPEWPAGHDRVWGQWSPLRGRLFPGTAIFRAEKAGA